MGYMTGFFFFHGKMYHDSENIYGMTGPVNEKLLGLLSQ